MNPYHNFINRLAATRIGGWMILHVFNSIDKQLMRWSNSALSTSLGTGFQDNMILLKCTGAKSGKLREIPLLATPLDDQFVLIASRAGHEKNPAWYYNLKTHPECSLLIRRRGEIAFVAREAEGEERERAWAAANAQYAGYDSYQDRTDRQIPVMILTPHDPQQ